MNSSNSLSRLNASKGIKKGADTLKESEKKCFALGMYQIFLNGSKGKKTKRTERR